MLRTALLNFLRVANPVFRQKPSAPLLRTSPSGPLSQTFKTQDFERSVGNYVADEAGNYLLDLSTSAQPLGYNHPDFLYAALDPQLYSAVAQQPATSLTPDKDWADLVRKALMPVAPRGLTEIVLAERPLEAATSAVAKSRGNSAKVVTIGQAQETLAFPKIRFPYMQFELENQQEEQRALNEVENALESGGFSGVVIAPITESANVLASPTFYLSLQDLCHKKSVPFIVDETHTGLCVTGQFWAFEHWGPRAAPDVVVFGGRMQAAGFFSKRNLRDFNVPSQGSALHLSMLAAIRKVIHSQRLLKNAEFIGKYLKTRLEGVENVKNVRGTGLYLAFDLPSETLAQAVYTGLLNSGVVLPKPEGCSLKVRPSLTLRAAHVDLFMQRLEFMTQHFGVSRLANAA